MCNCGKGDFAVYCSPIETLVFLAECEAIRSHLLVPQVIEAAVIVLRLVDQDPMLVTSSYLACLLLLCDSALWPTECATREEVIELIKSGLKCIAAGTNAGLAIWPVIDHRSLLPVLELANFFSIPEVAAFGLWCLTFVSSDGFDMSGYCGKCPICLIKKEIAVDSIRKLSVPKGFEYLKIDLDAIVNQCNAHDKNHLYSYS
eukprot:m.40637 g.40637  ORF g.40637 m.40637 type:complete len:202 (+) comp32992_c0_seq1:1161-1766(+)